MVKNIELGGGCLRKLNNLNIVSDPLRWVSVELFLRSRIKENGIINEDGTINQELAEKHGMEIIRNIIKESSNWE